MESEPQRSSPPSRNQRIGQHSLNAKYLQNPQVKTTLPLVKQWLGMPVRSARRSEVNYGRPRGSNGSVTRDLTSTDFSMWRDARLLEVSNGTVSREMTLLSGILSVARREWRLIEGNPLSDVRRPREPPHRDRRVSEKELMALKISAGHDLTNATARAYHAFLFAIETAMRAGEIIGLRSEDISFEKRFARLPMTKNGTSRDVPLSSEAMRLIKELPKSDPVFNLSSHLLDALWRKLRDRAAVTDLRFHDSRHEAITRLARKLDVLDLARMVGHRDLKMLMIYYNATAEELAKRLD
jgi:integrase